jgi:hypothetical protein
MKKLLLASVLAIASFPGFAATPEEDFKRRAVECDSHMSSECNVGEPQARVTITPPPYQEPPPIGWVYGPYTQCANPPQRSMGMVNVQADGLNVRTVPNGPAIMSLVNGTPLYPVGRDGDWLLVAPACDLTPTWAWSWNAGVPLNRCWVYF